MLNRRISKLRSDEGGFTLIELLVVILIIGILAAIALPAFLGQASKGAKATAQANIRASVTKVEQCAAESTTNDYSGCMTSAYLTQGTYPVTGTATAANGNVGPGYVLTVAQTGKLKSAVTVTNTGGSLGAITGGD